MRGISGLTYDLYQVRDLAARAGACYLGAAISHGEVAEWSNAPDSKSGVPATVPWVRIPPSPPRKRTRSKPGAFSCSLAWTIVPCRGSMERASLISSIPPMYGFGMYDKGPGFIPVGGAFFFLVVMLWTIVWKGLALWHAARREERWWFLALLVLNTAGILEIVYLFAVAKMKVDELWPKGKAVPVAAKPVEMPDNAPKG
jgi:hypothetical protein